LAIAVNFLLAVLVVTLMEVKESITNCYKRKILACDWSKSRHLTFTNTQYSPTAQPTGQKSLSY